MIPRLFITALLFTTCRYVIFGQQPDYIMGKIIDSKSSEPVPYATVHLKNSQIGVISNAEGDFRILNNPSFQSDSLIVSCIGYHRLSMAFSKLQSSVINNITLRSNVYALKEVNVTARKKRLNAEIIISRAFKNIKKNFPEEPFRYVSYYRDYQKDSINYLNLNEAIIQTQDNGFGCSPDSNRYKLLAFKKNTDFVRNKISPYYDLPETDHSDKSFKTIPHAIVGDQYGNEFYILLAHDSFRKYNQRTFDFVDTLTRNFIKNHWFSTPSGVYDGSTLLYKIDFTAKQKVTYDTFQGSIYIEPGDYSIHKLEYSGSYLDSAKRKKDIFNIEIEYGREPAVKSRMCLKYISFNNTFIIPDSTDNNFFKLVKIDWWQNRFNPQPDPNIIVAEFNHKIDPVSGKKIENYKISLGKREARITKIKVDGINAFITIRNDHFKRNEYDSTIINFTSVKDIKGNLINKRRDLEYRQFRELFVQEYNKPLEFQDDCFIMAAPLEQNCISISANSGRYWMNTPLKASEKKQDSLEK
jgi:hypothetical protein